MQVGGQGFDGFVQRGAVAVDRAGLEQVAVGHRVQQPRAVVGEHETHLFWAVAGADGPGNRVGGACFARLGRTEYQEMR